MLSSSGFRDALGRRDLRFNRESGEIHECLFLRPELAAYESALRRRVGVLASLEDPRLVVLEAVEHDPESRRVAVISRHASGIRLVEVLRRARERELVPDLTVALHVTAELLMAAHSFQSLAGLPHGAITPDRVIVAPEGEILLADYAFGEAIESAQFTPTRLWGDFGIAAWLGEPFSLAGDVRQCALVSIALVLGRPLGPDASDRLELLVTEVQEAAMIRGGRLFADPVVEWLRRALAAGSPDGFEAAKDAAKACAGLLTERERAASPAALQQLLAELDAPPAPAVDNEPQHSGIAPTLEPEPAVAASLPDDFGAYSGPGPEFQPVAQFEPSDATPLEPDLVSLLPPELRGPIDIEPEPAAAQETEEPAAPPSVAPAPASPPAWAPPAPVYAGSVDPGPRVNSPSPFATAQKSPSLAASAAMQPLSTPASAGVAVVEVVAPPIAAPIPSPPSRPEPMLPAALTGESGVKADTPIKLKNPAPPRRERATSLHLNDAPEPDEEETEGPWFRGWNIPWKYVAAAVVVLAGGVAAATVDWGSSKAATPVEAAKPAEAPPPPVTTGSIEVITNNPGAKVLVDGKLRGETPLTIGELNPGRHIVVVRAPNGNVRRTVTVKVGETAKIDLAVYSGWIVVNAPIELKILENGKAIGTAGEGPIVLPAGHHTIEVANAALEYRSSHEVDIQPGEEQRLTLNPNGLANLNAVPWAEVWLDGTKIGDTPLGNVAVPLGIREFVFKHPQFGERKVSTTVTGSTPAQISVDFTK
jgi:hypothetical protein